MLGLYLIVEAVGLGVIAWSFKAEDKLTYSIAFGIGACCSVLLALLAAPIPAMVLTAILIGLFRSKLNIDLADSQAAILSFFRINLPAAPQEQQPPHTQSPNLSIIDVEAVEVSRWF